MSDETSAPTGHRTGEYPDTLPEGHTWRVGNPDHDRPISTLADLDRHMRQEQGWLRYWFWRVWGAVRGWLRG